MLHGPTPSRMSVYLSLYLFPLCDCTGACLGLCPELAEIFTFTMRVGELPFQRKEGGEAREGVVNEREDARRVSAASVTQDVAAAQSSRDSRSGRESLELEQVRRDSIASVRYCCFLFIFVLTTL